MSCLFADFNVYGSSLSNNIRLSHRIVEGDREAGTRENRGGRWAGGGREVGGKREEMERDAGVM